MTPAGQPRHERNERNERNGPIITRRRMLGLLAFGAVAACSPSAEPVTAPSRTGDPGTAAVPTRPPTASPTPSAAAPPSPSTPPEEPSPERGTQRPAASTYTVGDDEVFPNAKLAAARVVEALLTYPVATRVEDVIRSARETLGEVAPRFDNEQVALAFVPAHDPEQESNAAVVYPQLGGLDPSPETGRQPTRSSVMVVVDQHLTSPRRGAVARVRRCIDVRLRVEDGSWRWEGLGDIGGAPVDRPADMPRVAALVLDHPDIDLPDSARWDIHAGAVDEDLLKVMVLMATHGPYRVTSLKSGHPETVFAREYASNHTLGRAVDIWSVAGRRVVEQGNRALGPDRSAETRAYALTEALLDNTTVDELGSPWDLDGPATNERPRTRSFTNTVHADHLHVAFDR